MPAGQKPGAPTGATELRGHVAILVLLADLGVPATRRALHRWMTKLPKRRRPPVKRILDGNRLVLVATRERLRAWVVRMDEDRYPGFTKIRIHAREVALASLPHRPGAGSVPRGR